jgi:uncharacterized protein
MIDYNLIKSYCIEKGFDVSGVHGYSHWLSVRDIGLRLAEKTGADKDVVQLFAWFHDIGRTNNTTDDYHGIRSARIFKQCRNRLFEIDDIRYGIIYDAIREHTDSIYSNSINICTCWDADRLDLKRFPTIKIKPQLLNTKAAKKLLREIENGIIL